MCVYNICIMICWGFDQLFQVVLRAEILVLTCQWSSRSLTCCLSSFSPVSASASLNFTPISSSCSRATLVSSGSDVFLWKRWKNQIFLKPLKKRNDRVGLDHSNTLCRLRFRQYSPTADALKWHNSLFPYRESCLAFPWVHTGTLLPLVGPARALSPAAGQTPQRSVGVLSTRKKKERKEKKKQNKWARRKKAGRTANIAVCTHLKLNSISSNVHNTYTDPSTLNSSLHSFQLTSTIFPFTST